MGVYSYHFNDAYFEDAMTFRPERWLIPDTTELERRLLSFSRGSRSCMGIHLAYAELYLTFAHLFRRFEMRFEGMSEKDMDWYDTITMTTRGYLKIAFEEVEN